MVGLNELDVSASCTIRVEVCLKNITFTSCEQMDFFRDAKMSLKKVSYVCFQDYFKTTLLYIYNVVLEGKHLLLRTHRSNSPYKWS